MPKKDYLKLPEEIVDWRKLCLQSLDLVLCAGNSRMSKAIRLTQRLSGASKADSVITHVASIEQYYPDRWNSIYVQESTTLNKWAGKKGVQKNQIEPWLENYSGRVYIKQLDFERTLTFHREDHKFWEEQKDKPYESGIPGAAELLLCSFRLDRLVRMVYPDYNPIQDAELHCTEFDAFRLLHHRKIRDTFADNGGEKVFFIPNRLPPWMWIWMVDKFLTVPCKPLVRIK